MRGEIVFARAAPRSRASGLLSTTALGRISINHDNNGILSIIVRGALILRNETASRTNNKKTNEGDSS